MTEQIRALVTLTMSGCLFLAGLSGATPRAQAQEPLPETKGPMMSTHAKGSFDVKMTPVSEDKTESSTIARMTNEKQFHGDLEATSKGEMLTAGTAVKGSAGYVLIERVTGTLQGRKGTFVLQHSATLTRGAPQQIITVVPDSGSDQLVGLAGSMTIEIKDGKHFYDFSYTLPGAH
jgi:hypothetical protein